MSHGSRIPVRPSQLFTEDFLILPSGTLLVVISGEQCKNQWKELLEFHRVVPRTEGDDKFCFGQKPDCPIWFEGSQFYHDFTFTGTFSLADKCAQPYSGEGVTGDWNSAWWVEIASWDVRELPPILAQKQRLSITQDIRETSAVCENDRITGKVMKWT